MLTARCTPRRARPQGETIRSSVTVVGALGHRVSRDRFPTLLPLFGWRTHSPSRQVRRKHSYKLRGTGTKTTVTRTNGHYKENVRGNSECLHGIYKKVSERTSKKKRKRRQPITSETVNAVCPHPRRSFTHDTRPNNAGTHPHKTPNSRSRHTPQRERRRCSSQLFNVFVGVGGGGAPRPTRKRLPRSRWHPPQPPAARSPPTECVTTQQQARTQAKGRRIGREYIRDYKCAWKIERRTTDSHGVRFYRRVVLSDGAEQEIKTLPLRLTTINYSLCPSSTS